MTRAPGAALAATLAALAVLSGAETARAGDPPTGTLQDGEHAFQVIIAPDWQPVAAPDGTLVAYRDPSGSAHLAITRIELGRTGQKERGRMVDEVERGVERATPGYKRIRKKLSMMGIVPVLDLAYERPTGQMMSRFLFFRRHTMVLSIGLDDAGPRDARRAAEAMLKSFTPFAQ